MSDPQVEVETSKPSLSRRAFLALYAESRRYMRGGRGRCGLPPAEFVSEHTEADTLFMFCGTVSGGDENRSSSIWRWTDNEGGARGCVLLVRQSRLHEIARFGPVVRGGS